MKPGEIVLEKTIDEEQIVIRRPRFEDAPAMLDYINALSKEQTYIARQGEQLTLEEEERWLKGFIESMEQNKSVGLLLEKNGKLVGVADVHAHTLGAISHTADLGITLDSSIRGMGIGTLLMQTLLDETEKHVKATTILRLDVFASNQAAMKLYKNFGFIEYGRLPNTSQWNSEKRAI